MEKTAWMLLQERAFRWACQAFGLRSVSSPRERAFRLVEEAIELAQVCGVTEEETAHIMRQVYSRPVGEIGQEVAGVGVTLMVLAESLHLDPEELVRLELARVSDPEVIARMKGRQSVKLQDDGVGGSFVPAERDLAQGTRFLRRRA